MVHLSQIHRFSSSFEVIALLWIMLIVLHEDLQTEIAVSSVGHMAIMPETVDKEGRQIVRQQETEGRKLHPVAHQKEKTN